MSDFFRLMAFLLFVLAMALVAAKRCHNSIWLWIAERKLRIKERV